MKNTEKYFKQDGNTWIDSAYNSDSNLAQTRFNLVSSIVKSYTPNSLLDVGCGDGRFLSSLGYIKKRIGIDYSQSMLNLAIKNNDVISYKLVDLNSEVSFKNLASFDPVDVITMMGVIHYLEDPIESLKSLLQCTNQGTKLIISFRNRLYNIKPESKYFSSSLTEKDFARINAESINLLKIQASDGYINEFIKNSPEYSKITNEIIEQEAFRGITDSAWNPNKYENWRQFTPFESIVLLEKCGFNVERIVPFSTSHYPDIDLIDNLGLEIINCTTFILVATRG